MLYDFIERWILNDKNISSKLIVQTIFFSNKMAKRKKKIVQQVLKRKRVCCKEKISLYETTVDLVVKKIFHCFYTRIWIFLQFSWRKYCCFSTRCMILKSFSKRKKKELTTVKIVSYFEKRPSGLIYDRYTIFLHTKLYHFELSINFFIAMRHIRCT